MRNVLVVLLSVVLSSTAYAQTAQPVDIRAPEAPAREVVAERTVTEEETTTVEEVARVQDEERPSDDAVAERPMPRGSFWWYVGIIVVAAVIISVIT